MTWVFDWSAWRAYAVGVWSPGDRGVPTVDIARAWYHSDLYQAAARKRQATSTGRVLLVDGWDRPVTSPERRRFSGHRKR
jgi:Domain of unknown function (DUF1330)